MKRYTIILLLFMLIILQGVYAEDNQTNDNNNNKIIKDNTISTNENYGVNSYNEEKTLKNNTVYQNTSIENLEIKYQPNPVNYSVPYPKTKTKINISNYTYYRDSRNLVIEGNVINQQSNDSNFLLHIDNYEKLKENGNKLDEYYPIYRKNNGNFFVNVKLDVNEAFNVTLNYPNTLVEYPSNETINIDNFSKYYNITAYSGERLEEFFPIVNGNYEKITEGYVLYKLNGLTLKDKTGNIIQSDVRNGTAHLNYLIPYTLKTRNYTLEIVYINEKYISKSFRTNYTVSLHKRNVTMTTNVTISKNGYESSILIRPSLLIDGKTPKEGCLIAKINDVTMKDKNNNTRFVYYSPVRTVMSNYVVSIPINLTDYLNKNFDVDIHDSWRGKTLKITVLYSLDNYGRIETTNYCTLSPKKLNTQIVFDNITWTNKSVHLQGNILTEHLNRNIVGKSVLGLKLNSITLKDSNNKPIIFEVNDGIIDITFEIPDNYQSNSYNLSMTSSERKHYNALRTSRTIFNHAPFFNMSQYEISLLKTKQLEEKIEMMRNISSSGEKLNTSIVLDKISWINKTVNVHGHIKDNIINHRIGEKSVVILKLNSITLKDSNNKPIIFEVNDGKIDITFEIPDNYQSNSYNLSIISGDTKSYNACRTSTMIFKDTTVSNMSQYEESLPIFT